jgi:hypothetical protein
MKKDLKNKLYYVSQDIRNNFNYYKNHFNTCYVLVGLFDRLIFKQAPIITNEEDFNDFMKQYFTGMIISFAFYAVPLENIENV